MAWSISITPEGWEAIYEACHECSKEFLWEAFNESQNSKDPLSGDLFDKLAHETLADQVYQSIITTDTCDNGGFKFWIDPKGYYKITPSSTA